MTTEALKSTPITNWDANPIVPPQAGEGGQGYIFNTTGYVISTAGVTIGSTYKMCRIPTTAKVKQLLFTCAAHGGSAAFDIDVAHSDSTTDGTPASLQGNIIQLSSADNKLFGAAISAVSALNNTDETYSNTFLPKYGEMELWNALVTLGATTFTANPGGMFDIVLKSTATDTSGGLLSVQVNFVV